MHFKFKCIIYIYSITKFKKIEKYGESLWIESMLENLSNGHNQSNATLCRRRRWQRLLCRRFRWFKLKWKCEWAQQFWLCNVLTGGPLVVDTSTDPNLRPFVYLIGIVSFGLSTWFASVVSSFCIFFTMIFFKFKH